MKKIVLLFFACLGLIAFLGCENSSTNSSSESSLESTKSSSISSGALESTASSSSFSSTAISSSIPSSSLIANEYLTEAQKALINGYIERIITEGSFSNPFWNTEKIDAIINDSENTQNYWNYIDGVLFTSLINLYHETNQKKYIDFVADYVDHFTNDITGDISTFYSGSRVTKEDIKANDANELDSICLGRVLFDLYEYTNDGQFNGAIDFLFNQIETQPRTSSTGNFWHKNQYNEQIWLDGLYMAMPYYAHYAANHNGSVTYKVNNTPVTRTYYDDIFNQYKNVRNLMFDETKGLYYHGYDDLHANSNEKAYWSDSKTGCSENVWLRALGWYLVSLVDVLDYFPKGEDYDYLAGLLKEGLDGVLKYQDKATNMFYQLVEYDNTTWAYDKDDGHKVYNYLETSGSAMISYTLLKAARLGIVDSSYYEKGAQVFRGICDKYLVNKNGVMNLGGICKVGGLGPNTNPRRDGSISYYLSEDIIENDGKGAGPFIMAYTELIYPRA